MRLAQYWRVSSFRLALLYGAVFLLAIVTLLTLVYWRTAGYMTQQIDLIIATETQAFTRESAQELPQILATYQSRDARHINLYGLYARDGRRITGNVADLPAGLPIDARVHPVANYQLIGHGGAPVPAARAMALMLPWGEVLLVGRDVTQLQSIRRIIATALLQVGSVITLLGLAAGFGLSLSPLRRVRDIRLASERIATGELHLRLPVSRRHDELDMLAATVNTTLTEIERLLGEVKSVCDNIAHDLSTPLTHLRARLYRLQQQFESNHEPEHAGTLAEALSDTDALLARFKALLRISEIEDRQRREAFCSIPLGPLLEQVVDLYLPLAEDQGKSLALELNTPVQLFADTGLLFEAISNLVDNAIKFSPPGGKIRVQLHQEGGQARLDIVDQGPGIAEADVDLITQRFYRGEHSSPGSGLGLSIVAAIVRLHAYSLQFIATRPGTCVRLNLGPIHSDAA